MIAEKKKRKENEYVIIDKIEGFINVSVQNLSA